MQVCFDAVDDATSYRVIRAEGEYTTSWSANWVEVYSGSATQFTDSGLRPETRYSYLVEAINSTGQSGTTSWGSETRFPINAVTRPSTPPPTAPPAAPSNLSAILYAGSNGTGTIVAWDAVADADGYVVERSLSPEGPWTTLDPTLAATSLFQLNGERPQICDLSGDPATLYSYHVVAVNEAGVSDYSPVVTAIPQSTLLLVATATAQSASEIRVTWNKLAGLTAYTVQRSSSSGGPWTQVYAGAATQYVDSTLAAGTKYYYRVLATDGVVSTPWSDVVNATTQAASTKPIAPTATAVAQSASTIRITWNKPARAISFKVQRSISGSGSWTLVYSGAATQYVDSKLAANTKYYYRVLASNASGSSPWSATANATTRAALAKPAAPTATVAAQSTSTIRVTWTKPARATGFKVQRSTSGSGSWTLIYSGAATQYVDSKLAANTKYYYRVLAGNAAGSSPWSAMVNATTRAPVVKSTGTTDAAMA
jgi:fibronectin type 3 domain-containing protein